MNDATSMLLDNETKSVQYDNLGPIKDTGHLHNLFC